MNQKVEPGDLAALLASVKEGKRGAFERLLDLYQPLLLSAVSSFGGDRAIMKLEAEYALYRAALAYRERQGTTFGLFAKICIINALTSEQRRQAKWRAIIDEGAEVDAPAPDPADRMILAETFEGLYRQSTALLSPLELKVVNLRANGYGNQEVAAMLKIGEKAAQNAYTRAVRKLKRYLEGSAR